MKKEPISICIVGAGSTYTPCIIQAMLNVKDMFPVARFVCMISPKQKITVLL
ncbi:hypothetical protein MGH68_16610 [Erysipelothrix sp. D19-032]